MNISVLMTVYKNDDPAQLNAALASLWQQTLPPAEVVLVKDGPLGANLEQLIQQCQIQEPQRLKVISQERNMGLAQALNLGLKYCTHEFIARMDADDICYPDRLEIQAQFLKAHPDVSVVGGWITEFSGDENNIYGLRKLPEAHGDLCRVGRTRTPLNHVTVMFRKSDVLAVGGYEVIRFGQDWVLWAKMIRGGYRLHNLQQPLVKVRAGMDMVKRRRGFKYIQNEVRLQWMLLKMGFIRLGYFLLNCGLRIPLRLMPESMIYLFYRKALRQQS